MVPRPSLLSRVTSTATPLPLPAILPDHAKDKCSLLQHAITLIIEILQSGLDLGPFIPAEADIEPRQFPPQGMEGLILQILVHRGDDPHAGGGDVVYTVDLKRTLDLG